MANTYIARIQRTHALSNTYFTLNNAAASGVNLKVYRVWIQPTGTGAVTGGNSNLVLERYTGTPGGGTATSATVVKYNTASATLPAGVTLLNGNTAITGTLTSNGIFRRVFSPTDEVTAGSFTWEELMVLRPLNIIWNGGHGEANVEPIVIREAQGLRMYSNSVGTAVGTCDIYVEFTT